MYIDTSAVGLESGPVGETNVATLISSQILFTTSYVTPERNLEW